MSMSWFEVLVLFVGVVAILAMVYGLKDESPTSTWSKIASKIEFQLSQSVKNPYYTLLTLTTVAAMASSLAGSPYRYLFAIGILVIVGSPSLLPALGKKAMAGVAAAGETLQTLPSHLAKKQKNELKIKNAPIPPNPLQRISH